jgi:hypothetical protein
MLFCTMLQLPLLNLQTQHIVTNRVNPSVRHQDIYLSTCACHQSGCSWTLLVLHEAVLHVLNILYATFCTLNSSPEHTSHELQRLPWPTTDWPQSPPPPTSPVHAAVALAGWPTHDELHLPWQGQLGHLLSRHGCRAQHATAYHSMSQHGTAHHSANQHSKDKHIKNSTAAVTPSTHAS